MTMGVVFFAGMTGFLILFGLREAWLDRKTRQRVTRFTNDDRAVDLFARQLEEIRNLPEAVA